MGRLERDVPIAAHYVNWPPAALTLDNRTMNLISDGLVKPVLILTFLTRAVQIDCRLLGCREGRRKASAPNLRAGTGNVSLLVTRRRCIPLGTRPAQHAGSLVFLARSRHSINIHASSGAISESRFNIGNYLKPANPSGQ